MRGNWGGTGTIPVQCPTWAILSLDHIGRTKQLCCISSPDTKALKLICEDCGLHTILYRMQMVSKVARAGPFIIALKSYSWK
ncbi:MAG: hypothetical protein ACRD97_02605 [Nitrososphaeraceae archaeon]